MGTTLYIGTGGLVHPAQVQGNLEAFDANGITNSAGSPTHCSPIWTSPDGYTGWAPLIAGDNTVFQPAPISDWPFAAFAANGSSSTPAWVSSVDASPLAVAGSVLYAAGGNTVYAFDAGGSSGCSSSACNPLWSTSGNNAIVANGIVCISTTTSSGHTEIVAYGLP